MGTRLDQLQLVDTWLPYEAFAASGQHTTVGTLVVRPQLWSSQLDNQRDIVVYLPPSYVLGEKRYPVVYMQDGQNLFDQATAYSDEWQVDETMQALSAEGIEAIVVGIPNIGSERISEYSPFRNARVGGGKGEPYLAFVITTIKPLIDSTFRTLTGPEHTGIFGASMGGLISLYAFLQYPQTFGLVGAMSPAFWFNRDMLFPFARQVLLNNGKIYLDVGTLEGMGRMSADVQQMQKLLTQKGYRMGENLLCVIEPDGAHNEAAWGKRLPGALRFLLAAQASPWLP